MEKHLKDAQHYRISKICANFASQHSMDTSKSFMLVLSECVYDMARSLASDGEAFAKHAKRSTGTVPYPHARTRPCMTVCCTTCVPSTTIHLPWVQISKSNVTTHIARNLLSSADGRCAALRTPQRQPQRGSNGLYERTWTGDQEADKKTSAETCQPMTDASLSNYDCAS